MRRYSGRMPLHVETRSKFCNKHRFFSLSSSSVSVWEQRDASLSTDVTVFELFTVSSPCQFCSSWENFHPGRSTASSSSSSERKKQSTFQSFCLAAFCFILKYSYVSSTPATSFCFLTFLCRTCTYGVFIRHQTVFLLWLLFTFGKKYFLLKNIILIWQVTAAKGLLCFSKIETSDRVIFKDFTLLNIDCCSLITQKYFYLITVWDFIQPNVMVHYDDTE